jgi:rRNA maturation endonuclease Nob1
MNKCEFIEKHRLYCRECEKYFTSDGSLNCPECGIVIDDDDIPEESQND